MSRINDVYKGRYIIYLQGGMSRDLSLLLVKRCVGRRVQHRRGGGRADGEGVHRLFKLFLWQFLFEMQLEAQVDD